MKKILLTRKLPDAVEARLSRTYEVEMQGEGDRLSAAEIIARSRGKDAILTCPVDPLSAETLQALDVTVKIVSTFSVGYEHVDLDAAKARGIVVTNTPDVLTDATADVTLLLILGAARRAYEGQAMLRADEWSGWTPTQLMGTQVTGKRLGIFGMGRIGQAVAKRARGFDMEVHYHNRRRLSPELEHGAIFHDTVESLLSVSDVFSLNCPLTPATRHFLDGERIALLPEGAIVVNAARGPVIDDVALIEALQCGRVAAAGLDVFDGEPDLHPGYRALDNAYLLPHLGSATVETRNAMGFLACDNFDAFFRGEEPPNRVV